MHSFNWGKNALALTIISFLMSSFHISLTPSQILTPGLKSGQLKTHGA
jgi:hypothetical protein